VAGREGLHTQVVEQQGVQGPGQAADHNGHGHLEDSNIQINCHMAIHLRRNLEPPGGGALYQDHLLSQKK